MSADAKSNSQDAVLVVAAVLYRTHLRTQQVAIFRRGPGMTGAGHWEFPGGKVERGESESQALLREIDEELGIRIRIEGYLDEVVHQYPAKKIRLRFYWVSDPQQEFVLSEHDQYQWIAPADIDLQILSEGDRSIVAKIRADKRFQA